MGEGSWDEVAEWLGCGGQQRIGVPSKLVFGLRWSCSGSVLVVMEPKSSKFDAEFDRVVTSLLRCRHFYTYLFQKSDTPAWPGGESRSNSPSRIPIHHRTLDQSQSSG